MSSKGRKYYRDKVVSENPYCPICGVKMISPSDIERDRHGRLKYTPDNMATFYHKFGKWRKEQRSNNKTTGIIMCLKCSTNASIYEQECIDIDTRRIASGRLGIKKKNHRKIIYTIKKQQHEINCIHPRFRFWRLRNN